MSGTSGPASYEGTPFPRYDERASLSRTTAGGPPCLFHERSKDACGVFRSPSEALRASEDVFAGRRGEAAPSVQKGSGVALEFRSVELFDELFGGVVEQRPALAGDGAAATLLDDTAEQLIEDLDRPELERYA